MDKKSKIELMKEAGIDYDHQEFYEVEDMASYFKREKMENEAYQGGDVDPEFTLKEERHLSYGQEEKDMWRRRKELENIENIRAWVESDENKPMDKLELLLESPKDRRERWQKIMDKIEGEE